MEPSSRPLLLVCTRKAVCILLNHIPCGKHVVVHGGKWIGTKPIRVGTEVNLYGIRLACYNTAILPIFLPTHGLAYSHPTTYGSSNLLVSTMHDKHVHRYVQQHAMKLTRCKTCQDTHHIKSSNMLSWF